MTQTLFARKHQSRLNDFPKDRTLFLINIPHDTTPDLLAELFNECGHIESATIKNAKCHVVFKDEKSIAQILTLEKLKWHTHTQSLSSTLQLTPAFLKHHKKPDVRKLQQKVDEAMLLFESQESDEKRKREEMRNVVDDDGFVLVTRQGRKLNADGTGATMGALSRDEAELLQAKEKTKKTGLVDFYRFQMREKKRDGNFVSNVELAELRRKFEEDKKKIAGMKQDGRFRPY